MTVATDQQKLEMLNVLNTFKLLKYTNKRLAILEEMEKTKHYKQMEKLKKELEIVVERRDEIALLLTLTFD